MADRGSTTATGPRTRLLDAALIGLPDAVTSAWCLWVWLHPLAFDASAVRCVVLMMLMEFLLLNATGFFTAIPFMVELPRSVRATMIVGLAVIYFALVWAFASPFHAFWPYLAFGWLAAGKLAWIVRNRRVTGSEHTWLTGTWAVSVVAYLGAVGIGELHSLPTFGIVPSILPSLHLPGGEGWVSQPGNAGWLAAPHKAVAAAVFYFGAVGIFKWLYVMIRKNQPGRSRRGAQAASDASLDAAG